MHPMALLRALLALLFPLRSSERTIYDYDPDTFASKARVALSPSPLPVTALLSYRDPAVAACIKEAKYHGNERAQELLGTVLADYLREILADERSWSSHTVSLVPIPLSRTRYRERGYNQTEQISRKALTRLPELQLARSVLVRTRDTTPQTTLGRRRRLINMKDAFRAREIDAHTTYIVVDDVTTTGATLAAAHAALQHAGATRIHLIALARQEL